MILFYLVWLDDEDCRGFRNVFKVYFRLGVS